MRNFIRKLLCAAAMLIPMSVAAQFYSDGTDAARIKWSSISTDDFCVIYPRGLDSLARVYAVSLERAKGPVGAGIGYGPNEFYRKPLPVVLFTGTANANGSVTWTPRRMQLYTAPEAYAPDPIPWEMQLAVHESRHAAQMQLGREKCFGWANALFGEITPGLICSIYGGPDWLEGDAVVAETALTNSGRGRTADFLEYYRASFAEGQLRNWPQWRYGSLKRYTPDWYKIGYLTNAGIRTLYDVPDFTERCYSRVSEHHGFSFFNFKRMVSEISGMKFSDTWNAVADSLKTLWDAEAAARAPYTESIQITPEGSYHTGYSSPAVVCGKLYAVRSGLARATQLVELDEDGSVSSARHFSTTTSSVRASSDGKLYWSEYRSDPRWEMRSTSVIMCSDGDSRRTLVGGGRFYNPAPSPDGSALSVTEYPEEGGSNVVIFNADDGSEISSMRAPDGMQVIETAWTEDGTLYFSALTEDGIGLWAADGLVPILAPKPVKIKQLGSHAGNLVFVSDRGGSNEIYSLDPKTSDLRQLTSSLVGASEWCFDADSLYYTQPGVDGRMLYRTVAPEGKSICWNDIHEYPMAEELSAEDPGNRLWNNEPVTVGDPKPYSKFGHLFHVHSWVPIFLSVDDISSISVETVTDNVNLGATAFFQNPLGTADGYAGVKLLGSDFSWDPSLNLRFRYLGWYPVIEANASVYTREAMASTYTCDLAEHSVSISHAGNGVPLASLSLKTYVPVSVTQGGISRGIIPQLSLSMSTNSLGGIVMARKSGETVTTPGSFTPSHKLTASLRGYVIGSRPESCVYPKYGIGLEAGWSGRPFMMDLYCSNAYAFAYGYLPGLYPTHGIRLSAKAQFRLDDGMLCEPCLNILPRGVYSSRLLSSLSTYPTSALFTFDYALPFASIDWGGMSGVAYLRNLELNPFVDFMYCSKPGSQASLLSAGADFNIVLSNFLKVPYPTRIGVNVAYNTGSVFSNLPDGLEKGAVKHFNVGLNFSIEM